MSTRASLTSIVISLPANDAPGVSGSGLGHAKKRDGSYPLAPFRRGLVFEAMDAFCPDCAPDTGIVWDGLRTSLSLMLGDSALLDSVEPLVARMLTHELRAYPRNVAHVDALRPVMQAIVGTVDNIDDNGMSLFGLLETNGVYFKDRRSVDAIRTGVSRRILSQSTDNPNEASYFQGFLDTLLTGLRPLDPAQRAVLSSTDALLHGLDLFADALGAVPFATCLRLAIATEERRVPWADAFYLWKEIGPAGADDLLAFVANPKTTLRDVERRLIGA